LEQLKDQQGGETGSVPFHRILELVGDDSYRTVELSELGWHLIQRGTHSVREAKFTGDTVCSAIREKFESIHK
jgi:hypothetical protein